MSLKKDKPSWGAPKIREKLNRLYPNVHTPAISHSACGARSP
jgi:putative transposase